MRILIADDHSLFRNGLRSLLESKGMEVIGEAENGKEAVELAWSLKPDAILMDLGMPEMSGLEATRRIAAELPEVRVVILTASEEETDLFDAIKSGAKGYLLKHLEPDLFFTLLDNVSRGEPALTPQLAEKLLQEFARPKQRTQRGEDLTERERDVLRQMVKGVTSNRKLAAALDVSENTIKFHVRNILDKLHLNNRAQVVGYALQHRIVDTDRKP